MNRISLTLALNLMLLAFPITSFAGASGQVNFNSAQFAVVDAIAYTTDDGVDVAFLSSKLDRNEVAKDQKVDSMDVFRSDGPNITLNVPNEGDFMCVQFSDGRGGGGSCNSDYTAALSIRSRSKDRIAGSFNFANDEGASKVSFDLPIESTAARPGSALPAGGGDPGKATLAHFRAIEKGDFAALKANAPPDKRKMMEASEQAGEAKEMFEFMRSMMPTKVKVLGGSMDGDQAVVDIEGLSEGKPTKGAVTLERIDGRWYVKNVSL